jgi:predicted ATP-dependent endonuclease of OLD family
MKLDSVKISNYRSVKGLVLSVKNIGGSYLRTLVGVNEAGKTNILKAIYAANKNTKINYEQDCHKDARRNGQPIKISLIFKLDDTEIGLLEDLLLEEKILPANKESKIRSIEKCVIVNKSNVRTEEFWPIVPPKGLRFIRKSAEETVVNAQGATNQVEVTCEELKEAIKKKEPGSFLGQLNTKIVYWKASPEYLISEPVNLNTLKNDKNFNIPLSNLFNLIGITSENLNALIERIKNDPAERRQISLSLSKKATDYIRQVWPESKVNFEIWIEENNNCTVHIGDNDSSELFRMNERSDGFKQFVSILLTLSVESRNRTLTDNIILIDEPEINLHPSSISYLLDELLKISQTNYLFVSTHSIFMIDKKV